MNSREEFEKWIELNTDYDLRGYNEVLDCYPENKTQIVYELYTQKQKIIDELKANNFAMSAMVCKHPEKRSLDENYDSSKDYCDMLKAENPDVHCPACDGTVSTVKALQYENKQLKAEIKKLEKYMYEISAMMGDKR